MNLAVIIGATREGRKTPNLAKWVANAAQKMEDVEVDLIDLKDFPMPFFNEPISPRYNPDRNIDPATQQWLKRLDAADAYVFVTPEYNHSVTGVLKNGLDYVTWEIQRKPALVVSHGSAGGARAATDLKEILSESRAVPMAGASPLAMAGMSELIDEGGNLTEAAKAKPYDLNEVLTGALTELKWYSDALSAAHAKE